MIFKKVNRIFSFTLIELLVVIAIISILVALIAPAIKGAKDRAKSIACVSNLHQIGIAVELYGQDKGVYPPSALVNTYESQFSYDLSRYLGKPNASPALGMNSRSPIFTCPASLKVGTNLLSTYSMNHTFGNITSGGVPNQSRPFPLTTRTSEIIMYIDGNQLRTQSSNGGDSWFYFSTAPGGEAGFNEENADDICGVGDNRDYPVWGPDYEIRFRHSDNTIANALFVDGHVAPLKINGVRLRNVAVDEGNGYVW